MQSARRCIILFLKYKYYIVYLSYTFVFAKFCKPHKRRRIACFLHLNSTFLIIHVFFSIESNFISPPMIARLVKALLTHKSVETFRAANQASISHADDDELLNTTTRICFNFLFKCRMEYFRIKTYLMCSFSYSLSDLPHYSPQTSFQDCTKVCEFETTEQ